MELKSNRRGRNALSGRTLSREHRRRATSHFGEISSGYAPLDERIDERIRQLCTKAIASEGQQLQTLAELQSALHEHNKWLRLLAVEKLLGKNQPAPVTTASLRMREP